MMPFIMMHMMMSLNLHKDNESDGFHYLMPMMAMMSLMSHNNQN